MITQAKFIEADQNWNEGTTTYWFEVSGTDYGTEWEFDGVEVFGIVEGAEQAVLDCDGSPLTPGDLQTIAVQNAVEITDEIRKEASGL